MEMSILELGQKYHDEASCIAYLRVTKESCSMTCPKCGNNSHYWNSAHLSHDCKKCGHRISLRKGTVMEASKLPFRYWVYALYLMTMTKKGFSALEMQRQLGHKRYEPVWAMMHKIRSLLGKVEESKLIADDVEMKNLVMTTITSEAKTPASKAAQQAENPNKKKREVRVIASVSEPHKPFKGLRKTTFHWVRFLVENEKGRPENLTYLSPQDQKSDRGLLNFRRFELEKGYLRQFCPESYEKKLHWAVALSGNAKRIINGIHHHVGEQYLQNYLDEFSYKTNHRKEERESFSNTVREALLATWYHSIRSLSGYTVEHPFPPI